MSLLDGIGIDLGTAIESSRLLEAAQEVGARLVRVRFTLADRSGLDDDALAEARRTVDSARALGLKVLAVVDGDLTVAPAFTGAFQDSAPTPLAQVWSDELAANAAKLAGAIGDRVEGWEILPEPNAGLPHRIAPGRWAALLAKVAAAVRAVSPRSTVVAGSIVSDEVDDGVEYLHAAYERGRTDGSWPEGTPPFDAIAIRLEVLPEGGASEDEVAAALTERTRRLWRVVENLEGTEAAERRGILVTGVSWDVANCPLDVQGRNAWTAFDTLTADPVVRGVVWSSLVDGPDHARGLIRGQSAADGERRPAWRAVRDFAGYAAQISPPPRVYDAWSAATAEDEPEAGQAALAAPAEGEPGLAARQQPVRSEAPEAPATSEPGSADIRWLGPASTAWPVRPEKDARATAKADRVEAPEAQEPLGDGAPIVPSAGPELQQTDVPDLEQAAAPDRVDSLAEPLAVEADSVAEPEAVEAASATEPATPPQGHVPDAPAPERLPAASPPQPAPTAPGPVPPSEATAPPGRTITFRIPDAAEVLRQMGIDGPELEAALAAVVARFGGYQWLPPGDYEVQLPDAQGDAAQPAPYTNQHVISALYRAGGGTWAVLDKSGLSLSELANRREQTYAGPPIDRLPGLTADEIARIGEALEELLRDR